MNWLIKTCVMMCLVGIAISAGLFVGDLLHQHIVSAPVPSGHQVTVVCHIPCKFEYSPVEADGMMTITVSAGSDIYVSKSWSSQVGEDYPTDPPVGEEFDIKPPTVGKFELPELCKHAVCY